MTWDEQSLARWRPDLHRMALRLAGNAADADDLTQEVCLRALRHPPDDRAGMDAWPWLRRCLLNAYLNNERDAERRQRRHRDSGAPLASSPVDDDAETLHAALGDLAPDERALLWRAHACGHSQADLARACGVSQQAMSKRILRCAERLRTALARRGVTCGVATVPLLLDLHGPPPALPGLPPVQATVWPGAAAAVVGLVAATAVAWAVWPDTVAGPVITRHAEDGCYGIRRATGFGVHDRARHQSVIAWPGPGMAIQVRACDHATGTWSPVVTVSPGSDDRGPGAAPHLIQAGDGHLLALVSDDRGVAVHRSPAPGVIAGAWTRRHLAIGPVRGLHPIVDGSRIVLLASRWSGGALVWDALASADQGVTWSAPHQALSAGRRHHPEAPHVLVTGSAVRAGTALVAWELHQRIDHPGTSGRSAHVAQLDLGRLAWTSWDGVDRGSHLDGTLQAAAAVWTTPTGSQPGLGQATIPSHAADGTPLLSICTHQRAIRILRREAGTWQPHSTPVHGGHFMDYQRGPDGRWLLLARGEVWASPDGATAWTRICAAPATDGLARTSAFVDDAHPDALWMACGFAVDTRRTDRSGTWPVWTYGVPATR
jgi:RNA polymerase sigma factor (sigma-70 family)